jgi:hypothetical protein
MEIKICRFNMLRSNLTIIVILASYYSATASSESCSVVILRLLGLLRFFRLFLILAFAQVIRSNGDNISTILVVCNACGLLDGIAL